MINKIRIRPDRFFAVEIFSRIARTLEGKGEKNRIPILMYHSISDRSYEKRNSFYQTNTTYGTFKKHMSILHEDGYRVVSLGEAFRMLKSGGETVKTAVITFDDGYRDFLELAWPIMRDYSFAGTVFISTSFVGRNVDIFRGKLCLSWEEISTLGKEGVDIGSHTVTHPRLNKIGKKELEAEIIESKKILEKELGGPISAFSCPYAFPVSSHFKQNFVKILQDAGYHVGVTTRIGRAAASDGPYLLKRLPINEFDDPIFFRAKINGYYDWMYGPQTFLKKAKNLSVRN